MNLSIICQAHSKILQVNIIGGVITEYLGFQSQTYNVPIANSIAIVKPIKKQLDQ